MKFCWRLFSAMFLCSRSDWVVSASLAWMFVLACLAPNRLACLHGQRAMGRKCEKMLWAAAWDAIVGEIVVAGGAGWGGIKSASEIVVGLPKCI